MTQFTDEQRAHYQQLSQKSLAEHRHPDVAAFFQRVSDEALPVFDTTFNGALSFFRAPLTKTLADVDIACVGVPMEAGAIVCAGQKFAPNAVREASHLRGPVHERWNTVPFDLCNIVDYGDVCLSKPHQIDACVEDIFQAYSAFKDNDVVPLTIGGVHTISHPIVKALGRDEPLGLIHIDAHSDTYCGDYQGENHSDAAVFRNAVLDLGIDPKRTVQIGIRGRSVPFWEFSHDTGMRVITMDDVDEMGLSAVIEEARRVVGDGPCYLTLDVDGIDATYMPGTQLPEPFGLTSREVLRLVRGLRGLDLVGADIVELCPPKDPHGVSAHLVGALYFEMLCLLSEARVRRRGVRNKTCWK